MRICIDCFKLVKGSGKSIGVYNFTNMFVANMKNTENEIIVFGNSLNKMDFTRNKEVRFIEISYNPQNKLVALLWELFLVNHYLLKYKIDFVIYPRGFMPLLRIKKSLIIIHDMIPFYYKKYYPNYFNKLENMYICNRLKISARMATQVVTISNASKQEIMSICQLNTNKIQMIYNGYEVNRFQDINKNDSNYILSITSDMPHKNLIVTLKSYERYYFMANGALRLIVIGVKDPSKYSNLIDARAFENIEFHSFVSDEDLNILFKTAQLLLFLSKIEGFGYPPIEAMSYGIPVICSNVSSLPEIVGDAAILVDPMNEQQICDAMIEVMNNPTKKQQLIKNGNINIKRFDWSNTIKKYMDLISQ